jgi:hypothetical protein
VATSLSRERVAVSCKHVATQLSRKRLVIGGGIANGAGKWQRNMAREQLMGHGHMVGRGLLQASRGELSALLVAGRKAFNLTKDGHLRSSSAWRSNILRVGQGAC